MTATSDSLCLSEESETQDLTSLSKIDRIGEAFCQAPQDLQRISAIQKYRSFRSRCIGTTLNVLDDCKVPSHALVSVRLKRLDSILRKILRKNSNFTLGRMDDVIGVRVICQDLSEVSELSERVQNSPYLYRLKNYISTPAETGYRGIHAIMRFAQPVSSSAQISVRFEIQMRSYLQHQWAIWSESLGESVKLGVGSEREHADLRKLSSQIADWEHKQPDSPQTQLPRYSGGHSIAVCWRSKHGPVTPYLFRNDAKKAVSWLYHLETTYPRDRANALLLVGVAELKQTKKVLRLTHPLYMGLRAIEPKISAT